jgi:non-haem Fe2+, alpha-ketoglutarate-dependent halogenase
VIIIIRYYNPVNPDFILWGGWGMAAAEFTKLSSEDVRRYREFGYCFPIRVFHQSEAAVFRKYFEDLFAYHADRLKALPPSKHGPIFGHTHTFLRWVYEIVSNPYVLDAVESVLGPNLLVWDSGWFVKMPGDRKYVSWHQDANYWGLEPAKVATAWVALSESIPENGCLRVIPGSHLTPLLPQRDTYAPDNALSRGQEIAVDVDEKQAINLVLRPGEMSLHDIAIIHGSKPNTSNIPRIGIAIRYLPPEVKQEGPARGFALLVKGKDNFGNFDLLEPPTNNDPANDSMQVKVLDRLYQNILDRGQRG